MTLVLKKYIFCEEMSSVLTTWLPIYPCVHAIKCLFLYMFHSEKKNLNLFATNQCNEMCQITGMTALMTYFLCNLLEKHYVIFIISWHCSLGGNFLADTLRYLSWVGLLSAGVDTWQLLEQGCWPHCITSTSVFLSKEAIWWPPWVEGSQILGTYSVLPYWWIKLTCITTIYHCCKYSVVCKWMLGFLFL